jgi:hypothetical protein
MEGAKANDKKNSGRRAAGKREVPFKRDLTFSISFARAMSAELALLMQPDFPDAKGGEVPSTSIRGPKRVDLVYSTPEAGLGLGVSLKSVHRGEDKGGDASFTHNMKRNDEELRVEATGHHLRQPFAVLVAAIVLPFESCDDKPSKSSFAAWVEYLWPLRGRTDPAHQPDRFELVFVCLYARDGRELGFYEIGGDVACPRTGRPRSLLTVRQFLGRMKETYDKRNGRDFHFEGETPGR